jgi:hypothetical protein
MNRLVAGLAMLLAGEAWAQDAAAEVRLQGNLGGDRLALVKYSDGTESDLRAGSYVHLAFGGRFVPLRVGPHALELAGSLGVGIAQTASDDVADRLDLDRLPLELLAAYRFDVPNSQLTFALGGGVQYQLVNGVEGHGTLQPLSTDLSNSLGWVGNLSATYDAIGLFVRYTRHTYTAPRTGASFDASSIGVGVQLVLFGDGERRGLFHPSRPRGPQHLAGGAPSEASSESTRDCPQGPSSWAPSSSVRATEVTPASGLAPPTPVASPPPAAPPALPPAPPSPPATPDRSVE